MMKDAYTWPKKRIDLIGSMLMRPLLELQKRLIQEKLLHRPIIIDDDESEEESEAKQTEESSNEDYESSEDEECLYGILGVSRNVPLVEIKRSYRRMALKHHPDKSKRDDAETIMKRLNFSYSVLSDAKARKIYGKSTYLTFEAIEASLYLLFSENPKLYFILFLDKEGEFAVRHYLETQLKKSMEQ